MSPPYVIEAAEVLLPSHDIAKDIEFWTSGALAFRMDQIYPADDPQVVCLSGHGLRLRLERSLEISPGVVRLVCRGKPDHLSLTSPSGTRVEFTSAVDGYSRLPTQHDFVVRRLQDNAPWVIGRAGMQYRDLIPSRLGGAIIASHIRIPEAGPVADHVHYHTIGFQLIYCYKGWARVVYEDQGEPFILRAGDCVTQPPQIRHRVLESSENLQVVEIGVPAEHMTTVDHELTLPTPQYRPEREWDGQRFVHSIGEKAVWHPWRIPEFEAHDTGVADGTKGIASVHVVRPLRSDHKKATVTAHSSDILLTFVLTGCCTLHGGNQEDQVLNEGDAYTVPPSTKTSLTDLSDNLTLLEVSLPASFDTTLFAEGDAP